MEDNFNPNNFEEFLKEQVRNHRMYPADTVWRDINKKLHGDKKWPGLTIAAFALLSATVAICVYFTPQPDIFTIKPSINEIKNSTLSGTPHNIVLDNLIPNPVNFEKNSSAAPVKNHWSSKFLPSGNISSINGQTAIPSNVTGQKGTLVAAAKEKIQSAGRESNYTKTLYNRTNPDVSSNSKVLASAELPEKSFEGPAKMTISGNELPGKIKHPESQQTVKEEDDKSMVDAFLKDHKNDISLHTASKPKRLKNKFGFQIYLAPSISYRKLLEDKSVLKEGTNNGPVGLNYVADVNSVVRHKPGNGLEAGVSILYYLTDNIRIKSGFQFNVRQYSIEAYRSNAEVSSIALVGDHGIDTVNSVAIYRNNNGFYSTELVNRYYQLAIPVGIEWEIIGNKKIQLNVAGSIQPTYLINRNAYLISTNFKNYSENPGMVRSFNVNSNIETFISFKSRYFKWQIGPQLRYQPYSTYIHQYPIKEHLMDYGIKIGLSKTF